MQVRRAVVLSDCHRGEVEASLGDQLFKVDIMSPIDMNFFKVQVPPYILARYEILSLYADNFQ